MIILAEFQHYLKKLSLFKFTYRYIAEHCKFWTRYLLSTSSHLREQAFVGMYLDFAQQLGEAFKKGPDI